MNYGRIWCATTCGVIGAVALWGVTALGNAQAASEPPPIITLTQTGCQFLEPEAKDHHFETRSSEDCEAINGRTGTQRLEAAKPLRLKPGPYIFRVTNKNVPYELGFYLRGAGLGRLTLPKVSGGGLVEGKTQDYVVELTEGQYHYSCPLNPTPDYPIVVAK
jgi:hypothetical protein